MLYNNKLKLHTFIQILLFAVLLIADRITKYIAATTLMEQDVNVWDHVLQFHYLENRGAAFGIFQQQLWLFYIISAVVLFVLIFLFVRIILSLRIYIAYPVEIFKEKTFHHMIFVNYIFAVLAAGAVGNLIDRIIYGYVIDFISLTFIDFPVFNFADICVTCAAVVLVVFFLFVYKEDKNFRLLKMAHK